MMMQRTKQLTRPARRCGNQGFTLMELMVSTLLLSIVMGSVYTLFHSVLGTWRTVEDDFDLYQDARVAMTILGREIENILPQAGHLFEGDSTKVTLFVVSQPFAFDARSRGSVEGAQLMRVEYYLQRKRGGNQLLRREALVQAALPVAPRPGTALDRTRIKVTKRSDPFTLLENVSRLRFRYIWMPRQEARRSPKSSPAPSKPFFAERHKERWGLPQGIEIELDLIDPEDTSQRLSIKQQFPIRCPNLTHSIQELRAMGVK